MLIKLNTIQHLKEINHNHIHQQEQNKQDAELYRENTNT